ncbi:MAG: MBL fold metallo-hydrolase [Gemmatimonadetes bacterium]|nr:MBL fold metallo-hydrolase [Gemmatimonadota bacterium]
MAQLPSHHLPGGRFRNPWPISDGDWRPGGFWRWRLQRMFGGVPGNPPAAAFPRAHPEPAYPHAPAHELRLTWVGQATFLIQLDGLNLLTDPMWSGRSSPLPFAGPARLAPPGLGFDDLPPIDAVLISHDHYDHLDAPTVRRLHRRFGDRIQWLAPLGFAGWLARHGIGRVAERDWWDDVVLDASGGPLRAVALPAQHWCRRTPFAANHRLWVGWALLPATGPRVYFAGDTGYCPAFAEIGERLGPFDMQLLPIGAYEPRWFMQRAHLSPEEAVQAYRDLGGHGALVPMHWGTFRLSDEDPLEPPVRLRRAWEQAGLPVEDLAILRHGETRVLTRRAPRPSR